LSEVDPQAASDQGSLAPRHYAIDDGTYVAVDVDTGVVTPEKAAHQVASYPYRCWDAKSQKPIYAAAAVEQIAGAALLTYRQRPTVVIVAVDANGDAASLDRLHEFPPGTSHEEALARAGYSVVSGG
jgi:hypothetical protein